MKFLLLLILTLNSLCASVHLTEEEKEWLKNHPNIKLGSDKSWPPFEYFSEDKFQGVSAEYIKLIEEKLQIKFIKPENIS